MPRYYSGDPYWINLRYPGKCAGCGAQLKRGERAFYFPKGKKVFGSECCHAAESESRRFEAAAYDEWAYRGFR